MTYKLSMLPQTYTIIPSFHQRLGRGIAARKYKAIPIHFFLQIPTQ